MRSTISKAAWTRSTNHDGGAPSPTRWPQTSSGAHGGVSAPLYITSVRIVYFRPYSWHYKWKGSIDRVNTETKFCDGWSVCVCACVCVGKMQTLYCNLFFYPPMGVSLQCTLPTSSYSLTLVEAERLSSRARSSSSFMPFSMVKTLSTASWTEPRSENILSNRTFTSLNDGLLSASKFQPGKGIKDEKISGRKETKQSISSSPEQPSVWMHAAHYACTYIGMHSLIFLPYSCKKCACIRCIYILHHPSKILRTLAHELVYFSRTALGAWHTVSGHQFFKNREEINSRVRGFAVRR